ncbi:DUF397 domain-containing protein [Nocardia sp. NPDC088792]|uniref:DUF397 domain-containing protein n=1 Tax=Nocardia sp. NPDC088792 TaxID=3364332 RepID=UPI0037F79655
MISRPLAWRTSSYSGNTGGNCVEVASDGAQVFIRDSKYRRDASNDLLREPIIAVTLTEWANLVEAAVNASKAATEPAIEIDDAGCAVFRSANALTLSFTPQEWAAFVAGAADGEFDQEILAA